MTALTKTKDGAIRTVKSFVARIGHSTVELVKDNGRLRLANDSHITVTLARRDK